MTTFLSNMLWSNGILFENYSKCRIWFFELWHFPLFCPIKTNLSGNTVWLVKLDHFWHFNELLSTQNVNVAPVARNVEWDFFCDFQTLCNKIEHYLYPNKTEPCNKVIIWDRKISNLTWWYSNTLTIGIRNCFLAEG